MKRSLTRTEKILLAVLAMLALVAATDTDTMIMGRFVVSNDYDGGPTCATATGDGSVCVDGDLEAEDDLDVGDDATIRGAATVGETLGVTGAASFSSSVGIVSQTIAVPFHDFRIFDDIDAILDQAAGDDDDLTLIQGTFGTNATTLETIDCGGLADTPQKGMFWLTIPPSYVAGSTISLVVNAGMKATVADQAATVDFSCYVPDYANADATVSTDLVTTAAQSVNSLTFANKTFVVDDDAAGYVLTAGDVLQCQITALCDDDGNAGDNITIRINKITMVIST